MKNKVLVGVQVLLALVFIGAASAKLLGVPLMVQNFEALGLGQWFRYLTAVIELAAGVALLVRSTAAYAAGLLCCVMVGAIISHLTRMPGSPVPAVVLLALCAWVARERVK